MLLALKCADEVNDTFISHISGRLGVHSSIIFHLIEVLRTTMRGRTERIRFLTEKRRESYFLLHYFMDMRKGCREKFRAAELDKKIRRERRHIDCARKILAITPRGATNSDIARILGLPKGTIDSKYFYLQKNEKLKKKKPRRKKGKKIGSKLRTSKKKMSEVF
jgi:hypothetical protein